MDGVSAVAGADAHRLAEGSWAGGRDEDFGQPFEDQGCSIYAESAFEAAGVSNLAQLAEADVASPKWRIAAMPCPAHGVQLSAGGDVLASAPREMTCDWRDDSLGPPLSAAEAAPAQAFQTGEKVAYWSDTHRTWMQATVIKPNMLDGTLVSYDLDVKRGAQVAKISSIGEPVTPPGTQNPRKPATSGAMREVPTPTPLVNAAMGNGLAGSGPAAPEKALAANANIGGSTPAVSQGLAVLSEDTEAAPHFEVGDKVEYWSETYQQWMAATVKLVREAGVLYDLDVKRGAQARRMRHGLGDSGLGIGAAGQAAHAAPGGQVAASGLSAVAQTAGAPAHAALASGAEGGAPTRVSSFLRGPSPLSGRGRSGNAPLAPDAVPPTGEPDREDWAPPRPAADAVARPVGNMGGLTPPYAAKSKGGLSLPVHNGSEAAAPAGGLGNRPGSATHPSACSPGPAASPQTVQNGGGRAPTASAGPQPGGATPAGGDPGEAPMPPSATPASNGVTVAPGFAAGGGSTPPSTGGLASRAACAPGGERAATRPSAAGEGATRAPGPLFMGTGMEGRRREPGASPAHGGRGGAGGSTAPRVSLAGAAASRRDASAPAPTCTGASSPACSSSSGSRALEVGELDIGSGPFDPTHQSLRSQLIAKLNLSGHSTIEEMQGFRGGLNEGVWYLNDPSQGSGKNGCKEELVLKLVKCQRVAQSIPTEAENCLKIYREHPEVINDPTVAFPVKIFSCLGANGTKRYDLIIMRKVRGERLAELIARKWYSKQVPQLMQILEKLGVCLAEFHARYGNSQHGDFQPSNIFCDEERDEIALIDVGGMGVPTMESDVEHFAKSMKLLAEAYGSQLSTDGMRHFERGYAKVAGKG